MIKVSVLISVFNTELYLRECLESVINQTLKDIEIICVNDGSTDNSEKFYRSMRIKTNELLSSIKRIWVCLEPEILV
ncbi:MAG: glycosyltransferase [Alphaproteobacteria bacterium]|nr:glycosyltransferase [Alphaproteobacteria bacterium]